MMGTNALISLISALKETFHFSNFCCFFLTVVAILTTSFFIEFNYCWFFLWVDSVILLVVLTVINNINPNVHDYIYIYIYSLH